jgi:hypothetical protein
MRNALKNGNFNSSLKTFKTLISIKKHAITINRHIAFYYRWTNDKKAIISLITHSHLLCTTKLLWPKNYKVQNVIFKVWCFDNKYAMITITYKNEETASSIDG